LYNYYNIIQDIIVERYRVIKSLRGLAIIDYRVAVVTSTNKY